MTQTKNKIIFDINNSIFSKIIDNDINNIINKIKRRIIWIKKVENFIKIHIFNSGKEAINQWFNFIQSSEYKNMVFIKKSLYYGHPIHLNEIKATLDQFKFAYYNFINMDPVKITEKYISY